MNITWLKLDVNILDDAKIKIIRSHPDGNAIFVLWVGLLCLAMKSSRPGVIEISDGIPYSIDDISSTLQIEKKTVELGLALFSKYKMIAMFDGNTIEVVNFAKHQNLERIEEKRELNRLRVAKYRERQVMCNALLTRTTCDVTLTEIDKKENKKENKNRDIIPPKKIKHLDAVLLTDQEHQKLILKYGNDKTDRAIEILNNAIMSKGYKYKSHYHTLIGWPMNEAGGGNNNGNGNRRPGYAGSAEKTFTKTGGAKSDGEPWPADQEY